MDVIYAPKKIQPQRRDDDENLSHDQQQRLIRDLWPSSISRPPRERLSQHWQGHTRTEANDRQRWHWDYTPTTSKKGDTPWILHIPKELRYMIYRYLLPTDANKFHFYTDCDSAIVGRGISGSSSSTGAGSGKPAYGRRMLLGQTSAQDPLAIMRVNRQLYWESLSVLYSENLFHFIGFSYLPVLDFIRRLSPDAREMVRQVRLTLLTDLNGKKRHESYDLFCKVIHDYLPFLTTLLADPIIWI